MTDALERLIDCDVVLDTDGPILYLGRLKEVVPGGYWLVQADVHDCRDGHASKEVYVIEAKLNGISPNRTRVFVMASAVISASALEDIVEE